MTQEQAKLTLADVSDLENMECACKTDVFQDSRDNWYSSTERCKLHQVSTVRNLARALSASQTALDDINNVIDELTEGNISESKAIANIIIVLARAALLDQGDGDGVHL